MQWVIARKQVLKDVGVHLQAEETDCGEISVVEVVGTVEEVMMDDM